MQKAYKYRIYPNALQRKALQNMFWFCRVLYNSALEERINFYKRFDKSISFAGQCKALPEIKEIFADETANIHSQVLQQVLKQLDVAYKNFFRRVKSKSDKVGFPRFKNQYRFRSICFPQIADQLDSFGGVKRLPNNKLKVFGLPGDIKIKWHRPLQGRCKQARISKEGDRYFLVVSCQDVPSEHLASTGKIVAIDLGITNFITTDDGTKFHHPRSYMTSRKILADKQRKLALKQRGSLNRRRALSALQKAHQKVVDIRNDFQHKLSKKLIRDNDVIIVEKLNIKNMLETKGFEVSKSNIQDASWGNFVALLLYKAENAGRKVIEVNPRNTSKMCSGCGNVKSDLTLQNRKYHCDACGIAIDRDINAAKNIRRLGTSLAMTKVISEVPIL